MSASTGTLLHEKLTFWWDVTWTFLVWVHLNMQGRRLNELKQKSGRLQDMMRDVPTKLDGAGAELAARKSPNYTFVVLEGRFSRKHLAGSAAEILRGMHENVRRAFFILNELLWKRVRFQIQISQICPDAPPARQRKQRNSKKPKWYAQQFPGVRF